MTNNVLQPEPVLKPNFTPNASAVWPCSCSRLMLQCCCGILHTYRGVYDMAKATRATTLTTLTSVVGFWKRPAGLSPSI